MHWGLTLVDALIYNGRIMKRGTRNTGSDAKIIELSTICHQLSGEALFRFREAFDHLERIQNLVGVRDDEDIVDVLIRIEGKRLPYVMTRGTRNTEAKVMRRLGDDALITVCDSCHQASCWQAIFMCQNSTYAGTVQMTVGELRKLNIEHPSYWKTDEELAEA